VLQYDIYLPLRYNDGAPIEPDKYDETRQELIGRFGGLTVLPGSGSAEGWWLLGDKIYRDEIRIFRVLSAIHDQAFWAEYKERLRGRFRQEDILLVTAPVSVI
jgi:hypothetical protein